MSISGQQVKALAHECGFELAGITPAIPSPDFDRYDSWRAAGMACEMGYLTDRRGDLRQDPRNLLQDARSIVCVGKLYNTRDRQPVAKRDSSEGSISRYAWGRDYHDVMRDGLERLASRIKAVYAGEFSWRICVDTAPLLERSYARAAGLGWIGKNTCLINQKQGSWFFLGELLLSIDLSPDMPPPSRCGTCRRCIDACPTAAIVPDEKNGWQVDARLCISYLTIEKRGAVSEELQGQMTNNIFGCDICQDVCPWNRKAAVTDNPAFSNTISTQSLIELSQYTAEDFRREFRHTPVWRSKYSGFLRNVAIAMGNGEIHQMEEPLTQLGAHPDPTIATAAQQSLARLTKLGSPVDDDRLISTY